MDEQEMLAALAALETELDHWLDESEDPHTRIACKDAIRYVRYAYESIREIA